MEVKVKPVQPSEIKDPKIAIQAIAEARRIPTPEDWARMQKRAECFNRPAAKRSGDTEKQQRIQRKRETLARLVGICADVPLSLEEIRAERLARQ